jgi:2-polyprenyl-3-methyl-5-hydroxy-6-metoxy-1,4-benzoquinol methylase
MELMDLRRMWGGFQASRVIMTANELGVFEKLSKPRAAVECARLMKCDSRGTEILLDALAGIGLIKKTRNKYRNTPVCDKYLIKGKPMYQGDILSHTAHIYERWSKLPEVVRTGKPAPRSAGGFEDFIMGMHNLSISRSPELLKAIGLKGVKTVLDLGGGPGTHAINMAKKGIDATIFDMPETISIAKRVARREGVKGIKYMAGDFHYDDIGSGYDLILMSQILHSNSAEENATLMARCADALNPGGTIAVHEFPLDETRTKPPFSALFGINMLVATPGGRTYAPSEIRGWLRSAGLKGIKQTMLSETMLITAKL